MTPTSSSRDPSHPFSTSRSPLTLPASAEQSTDSADIGKGLPTTGSCSAKSKVEIDEYDLVAGSDLTSASHSVEEAAGQ
jgi:hypothetical protein